MFKNEFNTEINEKVDEKAAVKFNKEKGKIRDDLYDFFDDAEKLAEKSDLKELKNIRSEINTLLSKYGSIVTAF